MRKTLRHIITLSLGLGLALFSATLTYSTPPAIEANLGAAAFFLQTPVTPQPEDLSKIGSTDGIVAMGFLIALIVIIPILLTRRFWLQSE